MEMVKLNRTDSWAAVLEQEGCRSPLEVPSSLWFCDLWELCPPTALVFLGQEAPEGPKSQSEKYDSKSDNPPCSDVLMARSGFQITLRAEMPLEGALTTITNYSHYHHTWVVLPFSWLLYRNVAGSMNVQVLWKILLYCMDFWRKTRIYKKQGLTGLHYFYIFPLWLSPLHFNGPARVLVLTQDCFQLNCQRGGQKPNSGISQNK